MSMSVAYPVKFLFIFLTLFNPIGTKTSLASAAIPIAKVEDGPDVCISPGCVTAAAQLLDAIDFSQDPCKDFSKFACGKWVENNPIADDLVESSTFVNAIERVNKEMRVILESEKKISAQFENSAAIAMTRLFYQKCMDFATMNKEKTVHLQKILQDLGGWPFVNRSWKDLDLTDVMGNVGKYFGQNVFLSLSVDSNKLNSSEHKLTIDQGSLIAGYRDYYLNDTQYKKFMDAYRKYIIENVKYLSMDMNYGDTYYEKVIKDIDNMITFERHLANITVPNEERRNKTLLYNIWTLKELKRSMKSINWARYFKIALPKEVYNGLFVRDDYKVIVAQPHYMEQLDKLLSLTDKKHTFSNNTLTNMNYFIYWYSFLRVLVNYIFWRIIRTYALVLDDRFSDLEQDLLKVFVGRETKPVRWKICVAKTIQSLGLAAGALYTEKHFEDKDKAEAVQMTTNIKEAFVDIVKSSDWMDDETKALAIEKADKMILNIGYADFIMNSTLLDKYYEKLHFDNYSSSFEIKRLADVWRFNKDYLALLKPFDRHKFEMSPALVNAFYSSDRNAIDFPAATLQPPFFKGDFPKCVNYGCIGSVIGHEITHGFDDQGSQYDPTGTLHNWWTSGSLDKFRSKTKCIVDQYSQYGFPGIEQKVKGKMTQGENIADNGGIKESYKAYKKYLQKIGKDEPRLPGLNFTNDQVFFLSYTQFFCGHLKRNFLIRMLMSSAHSPDEVRINGVLSNSNEFADAFKCKPGTVMNPDPKDRQKCSVW